MSATEQSGADTAMVLIKHNSFLWHVFRAPVRLYRWRLGWLLGYRFLLLTQIGRRTGLRRRTVLEVVEYRPRGPEVVVMNGFGPDSDWLRNIEANPWAAVTVGRQHFIASHRFLGQEEARGVIERYEHRNRVIAPIVRAGFSWLLGWRYRGSECDRQRLVQQLPLIAFGPRASGNADSDAPKAGPSRGSSSTHPTSPRDGTTVCGRATGRGASAPEP